MISLINSLEHLHVTIQESSLTDPKPTTSSQITRLITLRTKLPKKKNTKQTPWDF